MPVHLWPYLILWPSRTIKSFYLGWFGLLINKCNGVVLVFAITDDKAHSSMFSYKA